MTRNTLNENNRFRETKVVVEIRRGTNRLIARRLRLGQEQLDQFWVDSISSLAPLVLDGCRIRLTPDKEREAIHVSAA